MINPHIVERLAGIQQMLIGAHGAGIAAVLEVKSDLSAQWGEVEGTASRLSPLRRKYGDGVSFGRQATPYVDGLGCPDTVHGLNRAVPSAGN